MQRVWFLLSLIDWFNSLSCRLTQLLGVFGLLYYRSSLLTLFFYRIFLHPDTHAFLSFPIWLVICLFVFHYMYISFCSGGSL